MKTWSKTKLFMGLAGIASVAVFANVTIERTLYSDAFMVERSDLAVSRRLDDSFARVLASETKVDKIAVKYLELSDANRAKIDGAWEVMRGFEDIEDQVHEFYNKYENNRASVVKVDMELAAGGVWVRGEDFERFFYISDLTESGTISIVRKLADKHFEVLEARRIIQVKAREISAPVAQTKVEENAQVRDYKKGVELQRDLEMVAERALVPELSQEAITGELVSGSLSLAEGNIQALNVLVRAPDGQERSIDLGYMEIKDGGQFQDQTGEEVIHGIITNNGTDAFRIRFATGPLQGAMINFMTYEQLDIMREREEEARWKAEEAAALKDEVQEQNFDEVQESASSFQVEDSVTLIERSGFNFGADPQREPASN